jgi:hypothetical protein
LVWGAHADDDVSDPAVWRRAQAFMYDGLEEDLRERWEATRSGMADPDPFEDDPVMAWRCQWLNIWDLYTAPHVSPVAGMAGLGRSPVRVPQRPALVAVDEEPDGSAAGVLVAHGSDHWFLRFGSLRDALGAVRRLSPDVLLVGATLRARVVAAGFPGARSAGSRELSAGLPLLLRAVQDGSFRHDHAEEVLLAAGAASLVQRESGLGLKQVGVVSMLPLRLFAWVLWESATVVQESPQVW